MHVWFLLAQVHWMVIAGNKCDGHWCFKERRIGLGEVVLVVAWDLCSPPATQRDVGGNRELTL
jgi:hypothetical protein